MYSMFQNDPYEFEVESNAEHGSGDESTTKKGWRIQSTEKKRRKGDQDEDEEERATSPAHQIDEAQKKEVKARFLLITETLFLSKVNVK